MGDYQKDADHILQIAMPIEETRDAIAQAIEFRVKRETAAIKKRVLAEMDVEGRELQGRPSYGNARDDRDNCWLAMRAAVERALADG